MTDKAKEPKYYVVEQCTGDISEILFTNLFITDKESKGKSYVSKAVEIGNKYRDYYYQLMNEASDPDNARWEDWVHLYKRYQDCCATFFCTPIEFRKDIKITTH